MAYLSATLSLAAMELLVHLEIDEAPSDLVSVRVTIPDDLRVDTVESSKLPRDWRGYPAPVELQEIGDAWLRLATSAVLRVPSAVVPLESNYLVNPLHHEASRIRVLGVTPFSYDPRLF